MIVDRKDKNKKSTKKKNNFIQTKDRERREKQRLMAATNKMFNLKEIIGIQGMERRWK